MPFIGRGGSSPPSDTDDIPCGSSAGDVCVSGPPARRQACLGPQDCTGRLVGRMPSSGTGAGWRPLRSTASRRSGCPQALHRRVRLRPGWIHGVFVRGCGRNSGEYRLGGFLIVAEDMRARRPVRGRVPLRVINVGRGYVGAEMNIQGSFLVPMARWPGMRGAGWSEGRRAGMRAQCRAGRLPSCAARRRPHKGGIAVDVVGLRGDALVRGPRYEVGAVWLTAAWPEFLTRLQCAPEVPADGACSLRVRT